MGITCDICGEPNEASASSQRRSLSPDDGDPHARRTSTAPPIAHRVGDGVDAVSLNTTVTVPLALYSVRAPVSSKW